LKIDNSFETFYEWEGTHKEGDEGQKKKGERKIRESEEGKK
jgi:hypothetical protein